MNKIEKWDKKLGTLKEKSTKYVQFANLGQKLFYLQPHGVEKTFTWRAVQKWWCVRTENYSNSKLSSLKALKSTYNLLIRQLPFFEAIVVTVIRPQLAKRHQF